MPETPQIVSLATALAALVMPAAFPPIADAADSNRAQVGRDARQENPTDAETALPVDVDLMSFTVQQTSDGMLFPQHSSHSSHVSHASHASHASSSPGYGVPDTPYVPYVPDVPYVPNPIYAPPVVAPPVVAPPVVAPPAATTGPAPANTADVAAVACARASYGLGVNDIANELQQTFGLGAGDAANIARQALAAVLAGGHYCDGSHGE
ncbi:His-Xaa-Ser repeat protein HxsA2 [Mycolicibacterium sp. CH28]|uniref:His-Xaa-Ser repeat protein HxsA2 n=1 Tax=Mycolicibacterium sp. CH28 TaxID=2512237 RepID=UPI001913F277|nr:His-Xaa-Ser repeat protein HxsA2 [Mycolicibacterium sp. CH28]